MNDFPIYPYGRGEMNDYPKYGSVPEDISKLASPLMENSSMDPYFLGGYGYGQDPFQDYNNFWDYYGGD